MNNQDNYTIAEFFTLPSEGKVYSKLIDPTVQLRSMTTAEEMRRLSPNDHVYENLCSIIDDCMVKGPNISSYDMCIGDYQFLLYKLREVTYGSNYTISTTCPYCQTTSQETIDLKELPIKTYTEELEIYKSFTLPVTGHQIVLKMTTPRMLDQLSDKVKEFKRKVSDKNLNAAVMYSISNLIDTLDGKKPNEAKLEEFVRTLPMRDTNTIYNYSDKLSSYIGVDTDLIVTCDMCGEEHPAKLAITNEFFRPTLDI